MTENVSEQARRAVDDARGSRQTPQNRRQLDPRLDDEKTLPDAPVEPDEQLVPQPQDTPPAESQSPKRRLHDPLLYGAGWVSLAAGLMDAFFNIAPHASAEVLLGLATTLFIISLGRKLSDSVPGGES